MCSWDIHGLGAVQPQTRTPRLSVRCEYPDSSMEPTCVSFRFSPSYGILTALEAHDWFLRMMQGHEEFEVETDRAEELPMLFYSETVRRVVVGSQVIPAPAGVTVR